jgi:hypothetical protein
MKDSPENVLEVADEIELSMLDPMYSRVVKLNKLVSGLGYVYLSNVYETSKHGFDVGKRRVGTT